LAHVWHHAQMCCSAAVLLRLASGRTWWPRPWHRHGCSSPPWPGRGATAKGGVSL